MRRLSCAVRVAINGVHDALCILDLGRNRSSNGHNSVKCSATGEAQPAVVQLAQPQITVIIHSSFLFCGLQCSSRAPRFGPAASLAACVTMFSSWQDAARQEKDATFYTRTFSRKSFGIHAERRVSRAARMRAGDSELNTMLPEMHGAAALDVADEHFFSDGNDALLVLLPSVPA